MERKTKRERQMDEKKKKEREEWVDLSRKKGKSDRKKNTLK